MRHIDSWQAFDGVVFSKENDCRRYEDDFLKAFSAILLKDGNENPLFFQLRLSDCGIKVFHDAWAKAVYLTILNEDDARTIRDLYCENMPVLVGSYHWDFETSEWEKD